MLKRKTSSDTPLIDDAIARALSQLDSVPAYSDEYIKTILQIEKLNAMKHTNASPRVSPDTLAIVLGNLAGIVVIVGYERANAVTSKAIGFVMKAAR